MCTLGLFTATCEVLNILKKLVVWCRGLQRAEEQETRCLTVLVFSWKGDKWGHFLLVLLQTCWPLSFSYFYLFLCWPLKGRCSPGLSLAVPSTDVIFPQWTISSVQCPRKQSKGAHVRGLKNPGHSGLVLKNILQIFSVFVGNPGILVPLASRELWGSSNPVWGFQIAQW